MWPPNSTGQEASSGGARPRFGQLTYSSFDRNDGAGGGWQVKQTTGGMDEAEARLLSSRVQTQLDTGTELPKFPTSAEIEELPRKMTHAPAGPTGGVERATWHICPAGNDASGRPGNVFAHVVLDRAPDPTEVLRPVERWRSERWLTPYGPEQVLAAQLASPDPPSDGPVDRRTISTWLFAPRKWRIGLLTGLLDAVLVSLRDPHAPRVVLAVDDVDEAANWIAAVSLCMSSGTSRCFHFSTLERDSTLAEAWKLGIQLACIPRGDLPRVKRMANVVVLDSRETVVLGDLDGEPHATARGDRITVTEWSVLAAELFVDAAGFVDAVGRIDAVAGQVGDMGLDAAWPAAMVMAQRSGSDVGTEVNRVLARHSPPQVRDHQELFGAAMASMHGSVAGDPARAWQQVVDSGAADPASLSPPTGRTRPADPGRRVRRGGAGAAGRSSPPSGEAQYGEAQYGEGQGGDPAGNPPTVMGEVAVRVYAELALASEPWLAVAGPTRLPSADFYTEWPDGDLVSTARELVRQISGHQERPPDDRMLAETRAGMGFLELCLRLGLAHDDGLRGDLVTMTERTIVPTLLRPGLAERLLDAIAEQASVECRQWVWPVLQHTDLGRLGLPGRRVPARVLTAFGPGAQSYDAQAYDAQSDDLDPLADARPDAGGRFDPLLTELAWHRLGTGPDPDAVARMVCTWSWLDEGRPAEAIQQLLVPVWPARRLESLARRFGRTLPDMWFLPILLGGPAQEDGELWQFLAGADTPVPGGISESLAVLRIGLASDQWLTTGTSSESDAQLVERLGLLAHARGIAGQGFGDDVPELAPELAGRGRLLMACAILVEDPVQAGWSHLLATGPAFGAEDGQTVVRWCRAQKVSTERLGTLLLQGDPGSPVHGVAQDGAAAWLSGVRGTDERSLVQTLLAAKLNASAEESERVTADLLALARVTEGTADPQKARQVEKFLTTFLRKSQRRSALAWLGGTDTLRGKKP